MTRTTPFRAAATITSLLIGAGVTSAGAAAAAKKPRSAHVSGVITSVSQHKHRLTVRSGETSHTFKLMSDTAVHRGTTIGRLGQLKRGEHVGVMYEIFGPSNLEAISITITAS
ncbi:MAG: hypothetical protein M0004_13185 [Actinomycetota bacterium]|nr:hypothetical protein [Actinomycetota bacterium]